MVLRGRNKDRWLMKFGVKRGAVVLYKVASSLEAVLQGRRWFGEADLGGVSMEKGSMRRGER